MLRDHFKSHQPNCPNSEKEINFFRKEKKNIQNLNSTLPFIKEDH